MSVDYFIQLHQYVYERLCLYYPIHQHQKYQIHRIDSTMVCQEARRLHEGMSVGRKRDGKKQVKYTLDLTQMFPSSVQVFTSQSALSEDITMPITIYESLQANIDPTQDNVFVFDRGMASK
jgi:hypothetical protein